MKKLALFIGTILLLSACKTSYDSASAYDDVYYTPNSAAANEVKSPASTIIYGNDNPTSQYQQASTPESVPYSDPQSSGGSTDYYPESTSEEYYYSDSESESYYDYDYESRINKFYGANVGFGYYDPYYCGSSLSLRYGFGWPSSYFSVGFGWGYPYYSPWFYDPWYYPYYGYGYYPYYGGSYWAGYNHGYYDGYYAGGGGYYYPNEGYANNHYYGPRGSRGSSIIGGSDERGSRIAGDETEVKSSQVAGRTSRVGDGTASIPASTAVGSQNRASRTLEPQSNTPDVSAVETRDVRSEKIARPEGQTLQGVQSESSRTTREVTQQPTDSRTTARPVETRTDGAQRSPQEQSRISKPQSTGTNGSVNTPERRYAKPQSNNLERNTSAPKNYVAPNTNRPRSSNEYTVPSTRNIGESARPQETRQQPSVSPGTNPTRNYSTPSRSTNQFSQPQRSISTPQTTPATRNISTPQRSSSTYSAPSTPARSSGNSSSGRSSSGGSSSGGSSSGGSRGSSGGSTSGGTRGR